MRGTDALKAVALGASAVATGKLHALALAAGGEAGLTRMLEILEIEVTTSMALLGVTSLAQLDPSYVANVGTLPNAPRAFPFLPEVGL
jgi:isopentenyl diphosphate isomerase/L-lactate dehydrogenase-like FMN-dependent dehydrogenase